MQAEIVTIGTELLLGEIVDTNSAWIAQQLTTIGLNLFYTTTVGDNLQRIADVLRYSLHRSDVVITTGGLGPTVDDMTRDAVALATDRALVLDEKLVEEIACFFARRSFKMTENNRKQACLPAGARVIHNPVGTAPSFAVEYDGHVIISLPGVPHEMQYLVEHEVLPYLRTRFELKGIIKSRVLRTCGIGESLIDAQIGDLMQLSNPTVGTAAHPGQTDVRITVKAGSEEEAERLIAPVEAELRARIGEYVFGLDKQTLSDAVSELLASRGIKLAIAETITQGELAQRLGSASQGVAAFAGATILQSASSPEDATASAGTSGKCGFPSQDVADLCAQRVRATYGADLGLAVVGSADAGKPDAPSIYFSLVTAAGIYHPEPNKGRTGPTLRGWLIHQALDLVRRYLLGLPIR